MNIAKKLADDILENDDWSTTAPPYKAWAARARLVMGHLLLIRKEILTSEEDTGDVDDYISIMDMIEWGEGMDIESVAEVLLGIANTYSNWRTKE
jgi:hypothetical protein